MHLPGCVHILKRGCQEEEEEIPWAQALDQLALNSGSHGHFSLTAPASFPI